MFGSWNISCTSSRFELLWIDSDYLRTTKNFWSRFSLKIDPPQKWFVNLDHHCLTLRCKAALFLRSSSWFLISLESQYRFPETRDVDSRYHFERGWPSQSFCNSIYISVCRSMIYIILNIFLKNYWYVFTFIHLK